MWAYNSIVIFPHHCDQLFDKKKLEEGTIIKTHFVQNFHNDI